MDIWNKGPLISRHHLAYRSADLFDRTMALDMVRFYCDAGQSIGIEPYSQGISAR